MTTLEKIRAEICEERSKHNMSCSDCLDIIDKYAEQEPCEDAIGRQATLEPYKVLNDTDTLCVALIRANIMQQPSVRPQEPKWIPVSERLPKENKTVIASTEYGVYPEAMYTKEYGWEWAYESGADYWRELEGVTAWMPLPEPYEPQESEDEKCSR